MFFKPAGARELRSGAGRLLGNFGSQVSSTFSSSLCVTGPSSEQKQA